MNNQEQSTCYIDASEKSGETSKSPSPLSKNTTYHSFNNLDMNQSVLEHSFNHNINDPVKHFDLQRMLMEQRNSMMALKITEYENAMAERDYTIKSLHTDMLNSQNNSYVLTNQYKNIIEKTKLVSDKCTHLNTSFTDICERLNRLGDTVENAKIRQKEVTNIVDQTTNMFQEKMLSISNNVNDSLQQVSLEKIKAKQELEILENRYSYELNSYKINLEECTKEINNLRSENNFLLEQKNEVNIKLNEEKETLLNLSNDFEKEIKAIESEKTLLNNKYESINAKYEDILIENRSLKDELIVIKTSLDEKSNMVDVQLNRIEEQTEILNTLKIAEEMNASLNNDNCILKERNEYLEKVNTDLMDNINSNKLSQNKIEEEKETKFKDMCKNYDNLLKMQEELLIDAREKLELHKGNENKTRYEVIDLKQKIEMCNKTIINLEEEIKANNILIPKLQSTIDDLNTDLVNTYKKLQDSDKEYTAQRNELIKDKNELEKQNKVHFKEIERLTSNYIKYKSKAKYLYVEFMRLRNQCSKSEAKNTKNDIPKFETIEVISDEETNVEDNDDVCIIEFDNQNVSNVNTTPLSIANKVNQRSNYSSLKRSSPLNPISYIKPKKIKTANNIATFEGNIEFNQSDVNDINASQKQEYLTRSPQRENIENKIQIKPISNTNTHLDNNKKTFKIPDCLKPSQKKKK